MTKFIAITAFLIFLFILIISTGLYAEEILRLATTTSVYETGLLDYILPLFEKKFKVKIQVISVGSGKAIQLAKNADVDIILIHAKEAEEKFVDEGYGINRKEIAYNDYLILGPQEDPAKIRGLADAKLALGQIAQSRQTFISRGDDSGTHKMELSLWEKSGIKPEGKWYLETGQGMTLTLRVADEKNAYTIVDRATYITQKDKIRLIELVEGDKDLLNIYSIIALNPSKFPNVKFKLAKALINWLTSLECQQLIEDYQKNGIQLFHAVYIRN